ncbi:UNVERIFIED_CONTAM: hypothetical protein HDU68_004935 [Siphonaria sp. JEL0065]|nr:hypothetical protein HDU68_004935 [Siphonaria sp. JEL0065]
MSNFLTSTGVADQRTTFVFEGDSDVTTEPQGPTPTPTYQKSKQTDGDSVHIQLDFEPRPIEGEFNGWGRVSHLSLDPPPPFESKPSKHAPSLGEAAATAIAANDIAGSVLYTLGVTTLVAGKLAPLSLILVALTLAFPFRGIVSEVGRRIPLNGGIYSCVLLASSKALASVAACCSILDYMASAVVAAASAAAYFHYEFGLINEYWAAIVVLAVFGLLTMLGVKESSTVSVGILVLHMLTILLVLIAAIVQFSKAGTAIAKENFSSGSMSPHGWPMDLFLGYCVGMLGVTGFEKSANYIEEQKPGVFPKTLRNMCILSFVCNPLLSLLSLCIMPLSTITSNTDIVISVMADASFGKWLRVLVAVDAIIVLCGGVLTAFIGVGGLMERMANDNLLPWFLLYRPKSRSKSSRPIRLSSNASLQPDISMTEIGAQPLPNPPNNELTPAKMSPPLVPISFFVLSVLLFVTFNGDIHILSLVFAMAFLAVFGMYTLCCIILRVRTDRESSNETTFGFSLLEIPAEEMENVSGYGIVLAGLLVLLTVVGNAIDSPAMLQTFLTFFFGLLIFIACVLNRVQIARVAILLFFGSDVVCSRGFGRTLSTGVNEVIASNSGFRERLYRWVKESREKPV